MTDSVDVVAWAVEVELENRAQDERLNSLCETIPDLARSDLGLMANFVVRALSVALLWIVVPLWYVTYWHCALFLWHL